MVDMIFALGIIAYLLGVIGMFRLQCMIDETDFPPVLQVFVSILWPVSVPILGVQSTLEIISRFFWGSL